MRRTSTACAAISCLAASLPARRDHWDAMLHTGSRRDYRRSVRGTACRFGRVLCKELGRLLAGRAAVVIAALRAVVRGDALAEDERHRTLDMGGFDIDCGPWLMDVKAGEGPREIQILELSFSCCLTQK